MTVQYTGYERTPVTCVLNSHLKTVTIADAVLIQFVFLKMSIIGLETCRGHNKCIKIKNLCIKLVKKTLGKSKINVSKFPHSGGFCQKLVGHFGDSKVYTDF